MGSRACLAKIKQRVIYVEKIIVYPIKSLDGVELSESIITSGGSLKYDREFALFDEEGKKIKAKRYPAIQKIRAHYQLGKRKITLIADGLEETFHLDDDRKELEKWFSLYFNTKATLRQDLVTGFPDDDERFGPTVVSAASLREVQRWFPVNSLESIRMRFRANIELGNAPAPFWEDQLFGAPGTETPFMLGQAELIGLKPCPRCPVPARNPYTGEVESRFQKKFSQRRQESLPPYAVKEQFPHYYYLCVNTRANADQAGKTIRLGDEVTIKSSSLVC
jgi:uncharacterized protein YcbX